MVDFGSGFWAPITATGAMVLGAFIAWLLVRWSRSMTPPQPSRAKNSTYACGEDVVPEETQASASWFYSPIRRVFGKFYEYIAPGHSGDLNTYLLWVVFGSVLILAWIALELG